MDQKDQNIVDEYVVQDHRFNKKLLGKLVYVVHLLAILSCIGVWIYEYGFHSSYLDWAQKEILVTIFMAILVITLPLYVILTKKDHTKNSIFIYGIYFIIGLLITLGRIPQHNTDGYTSSIWKFITYPPISYTFVLSLFFIEISKNSVLIMRKNFGPARVLVFSFLTFIILGTLLLLLPNASTNQLSLTDAIFMATSAVCVTGLSVIDVSTDLTSLGQIILLFLFQLGGIGIMTLTSFFAFFFQGGASYNNQLYVKDFLNSKQLNDLFVMISRILFITFGLEIIGAIGIYAFVSEDFFDGEGERWFFAIFHAISGFCSAGFTLMSDSLYNDAFRFNYAFQLVILFLFIMGGLGFSVLHNFSLYSKNEIQRRWKQVIHGITNQRSSLILNLNSRIVLYVSAILFVIGTIVFYILEYNNTLSEHSGFGRLVVAMFAGATPRSAGFNNIDMEVVTFPTIMILLLYMYIGTGPGSTGGGIKVTTFAVALMNILSLVRGKDRIEVMGREISSDSIKRAFAVIALSILFIGLAVFLLSIFDGEKGLLPIAFECFSAYCTVGLSMGITPDLSDAGKIVLSTSMFIGRLSAITILAAMLSQIKTLSYRYPQDDIYMT